MRAFKYLSATFLFLLVLVWSFDGVASGKILMKTPTRKISLEEYPVFSDDLDFKNIEQAMTRQLDAFHRVGTSGAVILEGKEYPFSLIKQTVLSFHEVVKNVKQCLLKKTRSECFEQLNAQIRDGFDIYVPVTKEDSSLDAHYTAYYSPTLKGSRVKTAEFPYGIYSRPSERLLQKLSRVDILFDDKLEGYGYEQFYVSDPFELYLFDIEGGGGIEVDTDDGKKLYYLSYDGSNKQSFSFISNYMLAQGMIANKKMATQKQYLREHPESWRDIYSQCPSYIFFKESSHEPVGLENIPLTENRSIALDKRIYKRKGLLTFVIAQRPVEGESEDQVHLKSFSRFYIDQDSGGAIRGEARGDLYFGFGEYAAKTAHSLRVRDGKMYFLIAKTESSR